MVMDSMPENLPILLESFINNNMFDAVFGSRMLHKLVTLAGGMYIYKFVGNLILHGRRGILDITHTQLYTVNYLRCTLRYASYCIVDQNYIPAPHPLALGLNILSKFLAAVNRFLACICLAFSHIRPII
jgi:hypothetical protein